METKECYCCREIKNVSEFHRRKNSISGYRNECKICRKLGKKRDKNSLTKKCSKCNKEFPNTSDYFFEYKNKKQTRFRSICKSCHVDQNMSSHFKNRYGKTKDEIDLLKKQQYNKCAICGKECELFVDHEHKSNKFRGLLCTQCNTGIGMLKDDVTILDNAIKYINAYNNLK